MDENENQPEEKLLPEALEHYPYEFDGMNSFVEKSEFIETMLDLRLNYYMEGIPSVRSVIGLPSVKNFGTS